MAVIELGTTKVATKLVRYALGRSTVTQGLNCLAGEGVEHQFSATRNLFGKNTGIQAHHVIQSFKPGEITPEQANEIGLKLAEQFAQGYECLICTHSDKSHIHNHIVINSVDFESGRKFHHDPGEALKTARNLSDQLCQEHGLSVIEKETAKERHTMAEEGLRLRGKTPWKDVIRTAVEHELVHSTGYDNFKQNMQDKHGITVHERGQTVTYRMEGMGKAVRGRRLGMNYELNTISNIDAAIKEKQAEFEKLNAKFEKRNIDYTKLNNEVNRFEKAYDDLYNQTSMTLPNYFNAIDQIEAEKQNYLDEQTNFFKELEDQRANLPKIEEITKVLDDFNTSAEKAKKGLETSNNLIKKIDNLDSIVISLSDRQKLLYEAEQYKNVAEKSEATIDNQKSHYESAIKPQIDQLKSTPIKTINKQPEKKPAITTHFSRKTSSNTEKPTKIINQLEQKYKEFKEFSKKEIQKDRINVINPDMTTLINDQMSDLDIEITMLKEAKKYYGDQYLEHEPLEKEAIFIWKNGAEILKNKVWINENNQLVFDDPEDYTEQYAKKHQAYEQDYEYDNEY